MIPLSVLLLYLTTAMIASINQDEMKIYEVKKITSEFPIDAKWDKPPWTDIDALQVSLFMGNKPSHLPTVRAKLAYDEKHIYVIFRVADQYVRATRTKHQSDVYKDSCVEFFFSPKEHSDDGYFNLEMNCSGTMLFHFQREPRRDQVLIKAKDIDQIEVAHTMPSVVDPEIKTPIVWTVEYAIPFSILKNYDDLAAPTSGTVWRSNFYKCADETSQPHWLTWAPIDFPRPNFHLPSFFGKLKFQ